MTHGCKDKTVCPYFQRNDQRCAERFNLQRLHEVFDHCLGDFSACDVHGRLALADEGGEIEPRTCAAI